MSDNDLAKDIVIVPTDRIVEKKTMCANCIHFDADATRNMEECRPSLDRDIERARTAIKWGGLQIRGFEQGNAALRVANAAARGISAEQAMLEVEQAMLLEARRRVGPLGDPAEADIRMVTIREIERDIASGKLGKCRGHGLDNDDSTPLDPQTLIYSAYHCSRWSGRPGWSLAHDVDRRLDPLPAELVDIAESKAKPNSGR